MTPVEFHFDVGSPNAYLCHAVLPAIEARTGVRFTYVPVLLGGLFKLTGNQSPMTAFAGIRNKMEYQRLEISRFIRRHAIAHFRFNPHFPINTLLVMRAAIAAEQEGVSVPYVDTVFRAIWEEGRKMDDPAVAAVALDEAGFDGARLLARAGEPEIKAQLVHNTEQAVERGAFGAPTFFVGHEMFFGKDSLGAVEEAITLHAVA